MSFADDGSTFASKPFTFIVESKPLYIHAALVAAHSEPLNRMINGHLSEARQGFAVLDDVDEGTFLRFVRWTYSNDYPAQEHRSVDPFEDPAPTKDTTTAGPNTRISSSGRIVKKKKKKTKPAVMGYLRESFIYSQLDVEPFSYIVPAARANEGPDEDYIPVFLGHARVYVFAEKYDIQDLKLLALQKLQHQLAIHTLYIERVCEIMSLLKYVYANTYVISSHIYHLYVLSRFGISLSCLPRMYAMVIPCV